MSNWFKFDSTISCKLPHSKPFVKTKVTNVGVELCQSSRWRFVLSTYFDSAQLLLPFYFVSLAFFVNNLPEKAEL